MLNFDGTINIAAVAEVGGFMLLGLGAFVILLALVITRRHSPRCPKCAYDLASLCREGEAAPACPECGFTASSPRRLTRSRLHRGWLVAGVLIALSSNALFAIPRVAAAGWIGAVPSCVLVLVRPWHDPAATEWNDPVRLEIRRRIDEDQLGSPASELLVLRTELTFLPSGRWGVSGAELRRAREQEMHLPIVTDDSTFKSYVEELEQASGRSVQLDLEGLRDLGLDPTSLEIVHSNSPDAFGRYGEFPVTSGSDIKNSESWHDVWPLRFRGEILITPRPDEYAVVTSFGRLPGATIEDTYQSLEWIENDRRLHSGLFDREAIIEAVGRRVLFRGLESAAAHLTLIHDLACRPTPVPWSPVTVVDLSKARGSLEKLETTRIEGDFTGAAINDVLAAIEKATASSVTRLWREPHDAARLKEVGAGPHTAVELLDAVVERRSEPDLAGAGSEWGWTIFADGSVRIGDAAISDMRSEALLIYGIEALLAHSTPVEVYDLVTRSVDVPSWSTMESEFSAARRPAVGTITGSRLFVRASLITHVRLERFLRERLAER